MKKINKAVMAMGTLGALAAPIATVISCGSGKSYKSVVLIKTTYSQTGPQYKAMKSIVDQYNKTKPKMKVELLHIEGGYGTIAPKDSNDMKLNNMDNVANLFIDYPDALGIVSTYKRTLDLSKYGVNRSDFVKGFMSVNDQIQGTEGGVVGEQLYYAPISTSTEMLTANLPILKKVFKDIVKAGGSVAGLSKTGSGELLTWKVDQKGQSGVLKNALNFIEGKAADGTSIDNTTDDATINEIWGKTPNADKLKTLAITSDTFKTYDDLAKFAVVVQNAYNPVFEKHAYVVGHDAPSNALLQAIYSKSGFTTTSDKFMYGVKDGNPVYGFQDNTKTDVKKNIITGANVFEDAVNNKSWKFAGGGAYSSSDLTKHTAIFSWGSTSGYSHNYSGKMAGIPQFAGKKLTDRIKKIIAKDPSWTGDVDKVKAIGMTDDKYKNPVYKKSEKLSKPDKYAVFVEDAAADEITKNINDDGTKNKVFISKDVLPAGTTGVIKAYEKEYKGKAEVYNTYDASKITLDDKGVATTLQLEEASFTMAPNKVSRGDAKETSMLQGPSLIPVKHNNASDQGAADFIKWFFAKKSKIGEGQDESTIVDYFQEKAQYIVPLKGKFVPNYGKKEDGSPEISGTDKNIKNYKEGNQIVYKTFAGIEAENSSKNAFQAPVTRYSGSIRKNVIDPTLKDYWTVTANLEGNAAKTRTSEEIYGKLKGYAATSGIKA